jgi:hypothetical protein
MNDPITVDDFEDCAREPMSPGDFELVSSHLPGNVNILRARAVLSGRPVYWGVAHGGAKGLLMLLDILREEVEMTMTLCSRPTIASLDRTVVSPLPELTPSFTRA